MALIIAHRAGFPENTLLAIRRSLTYCDGIEIDVQSTKDKVLVLMHDKKINRTTNGKGRLSDYRLADLKKFKTYGQKIPTLEEAIKYVKHKWIIIELKEQGLEGETIRLIKKYAIQERVIISSFNYGILKKIHELDSSLWLGKISMHPSLLFLQKDKICKSIHYHENPLNRFFIRIARKKYKVFLWTTSKLGDVDGIITDHPERLR